MMPRIGTMATATRASTAPRCCFKRSIVGTRFTPSLLSGDEGGSARMRKATASSVRHGHDRRACQGLGSEEALRSPLIGDPNAHGIARLDQVAVGVGCDAEGLVARVPGDRVGERGGV